MVFVALLMLTLCSCGDTTEEATDEITYASSRPQTKGEIVERLNSVIADAKESNPAISYSLKQKAGGADCENKEIKSAFKTVAGYITAESFSQSTAYGDSSKDIFPLMGSEEAGALSLDGVRVAYITDNMDASIYTIVIKIYPETNPENGTDSVYGNLYKIPNDQDILAEMGKLSSILTAESYDAEYGVGTVRAEIDKATDHLLKLELSRDVDVATEVTGHGTLESVGTVPLTFTYSSTAKYELDWDNPNTDAIEK